MGLTMGLPVKSEVEFRGHLAEAGEALGFFGTDIVVRRFPLRDADQRLTSLTREHSLFVRSECVPVAGTQDCFVGVVMPEKVSA